MKPAAIPLILAVVAAATTAHASDFAEPPDNEPVVATSGPYPDYDEPPPPYFHHPTSTLRISVGPTLRLDDQAAAGGLLTALDIGEKAAGARLSAAFIQVGSDRGLAQYGGELWLDFGYQKRLHPILGAGAAFAQLTRADAAGETITGNVGVGTLRGSLQYLLPVHGADARASLDVIGAVPAVQSDSFDSKPWVLFSATVAVGF